MLISNQSNKSAIGALIHYAGLTLFVSLFAACKGDDDLRIGELSFRSWLFESTYSYQFRIDRYVTFDGKRYPVKRSGEFVYFKMDIDSADLTRRLEQIRPVLTRHEENGNPKIYYRKEGILRTFKNPARIRIVDSLFIEPGLKTSDAIIDEEGPDSKFLYFITVEFKFSKDKKWYSAGLMRRDSLSVNTSVFFLQD